MKPILQALLLADHVYTDKQTGKKIIAGIFNQYLIIPKDSLKREIVKDGKSQQMVAGGMQPGSPSLYINLTELRGEAEFTLRYVDLEFNKAILQTEFKIESSDPLATVEVVLPMPSLQTNKIGVHALELLHDNEILGSLRIIITEFKSSE